MKGKIEGIYNKVIKFIKENNKGITIGGGVIAVGIACTIVVVNMLTPRLKLESPDKEITSRYKEEIVIPATLSRLPNNEYPASSICIKFDKDKLEFVDFEMGTMQTYNDYDETKDEEATYKTPKWTYNVDVANQEGEIKAMYLDTTAGKNAYTKKGFKKDEKDIPFKLILKLKETVSENDKLTIEIDEAVLATVEGEKTTLSTKDGYGKLKVKDATIKIKE